METVITKRFVVFGAAVKQRKLCLDYLFESMEHILLEYIKHILFDDVTQ